MAFVDTFDGAAADTPLSAWTPTGGSAWTPSGSDGITVKTSGAIRTTLGSARHYTCDDQGSADHATEVVFASLTGNSNAYACVRLVDASNLVGLRINGSGSTGLRLTNLVAGIATDFVSLQGVVGVRYRIEAEGTAIRLYSDGSLVGEYTVATNTGETSQGLRSANNISADWITEFKAEALGAASATATAAPAGLSAVAASAAGMAGALAMASASLFGIATPTAQALAVVSPTCAPAGLACVAPVAAALARAEPAAALPSSGIAAPAASVVAQAAAAVSMAGLAVTPAIGQGMAGSGITAPAMPASTSLVAPQGAAQAASAGAVSPAAASLLPPVGSAVVPVAALAVAGLPQLALSPPSGHGVKPSSWRHPAFSEALAEAYAVAPSASIILHTLELWHPAFTLPVRLVRDRANLAARIEPHAARDAGAMVDFLAFAFDLVPPEVDAAGAPSCVIEIDNVSRELLAQIELATTSIAPIEVIYRAYLDTTADAGPENDPPLTLVVKSITANVFRLRATCGFSDLVNRRFPRADYDATRFPGLVAQ